MTLLRKTLIPAVAVVAAAIGIGMVGAENAIAKSFTPDEIDKGSYVIGEYLFTREANAEVGYKGYIDTRTIMLAAKTISGDSIDDMNIYYKKADGSWVDGLTNSPVKNLPRSFNIEHKNLDPYVPTPNFVPREISESNVSEYVAGFITSGCMFDLYNIDDYAIGYGGDNPQSKGFITETFVPVSEIGEFANAVNEEWGGGKELEKVTIDGTEYYGAIGAMGSLVGEATDAILPVHTEDTTYHLLFRSYKEVGDRKIYGGIQKLDVVIPGYTKPEFTVERRGYEAKEIAGVMVYEYELAISNYDYDGYFAYGNELIYDEGGLIYGRNLAARFEAFVLADGNIEAVVRNRAETVGLSRYPDNYCDIMIGNEKYCYINADEAAEESSVIVELPKDKEYIILMRACRTTGDTELCSGYSKNHIGGPLVGGKLNRMRPISIDPLVE